MIKSMTAFSRAEKTEAKFTSVVEIRSYNSRYLDIVTRIPQTYLSLEDKIRNLISEKIVRGRIEIKLQIQDSSEASCIYEIDDIKANAYNKALWQLKERFGINTEISLDFFTNVSGIIKPAEIEKNIESLWPVISNTIINALDDLNEMRVKEGDFIAKDLKKRLNDIEEEINKIESDSSSLVSHYQQRLKKRITELTNGIVEIDPSRIAQEAAFLADKSDISEEIVRSKSHVKQFRAIMDSQEPGGRKLNFLLQEFNREFNTIGSKIGNADISHIVVGLKSELEKIREQIQNVE